MTQSAMLHLGTAVASTPRSSTARVTLTESTSPNSLLIASLDAARRLAVTRGREADRRDARRGRRWRTRRSARSPASTCSTSASSGDRASSATTRCASPSTSAGSRSTATSSRDCCARPPTSTSSSRARTSSSACSGWPSTRRRWPTRFVAALRARRRPGRSRDAAARSASRRAPPWGELVMTPREAFLGAQEVVEAAGRRRADRRRVARDLPAGNPQRAPRRAPDRGDARATSSARSSSAAACAAPAIASCARSGWWRRAAEVPLGTLAPPLPTCVNSKGSHRACKRSPLLLA